MIARRLILLSGLAATALTLTACNRDVVEPEEVFVDPRVAQIDRLDIGRSPGGWIVTAHARDQRGLVERMEFEPVETEGEVKSYDLVSTVTEFVAPNLGTLTPQSGVAALFIPDADLDGIIAIEVRAVNGSQTISVPQRAVAQ